MSSGAVPSTSKHRIDSESDLASSSQTKRTKTDDPDSFIDPLTYIEELSETERIAVLGVLEDVVSTAEDPSSVTEVDLIFRRDLESITSMYDKFTGKESIALIPEYRTLLEDVILPLKQREAFSKTLEDRTAPGFRFLVDNPPDEPRRRLFALYLLSSRITHAQQDFSVRAYRTVHGASGPGRIDVSSLKPLDPVRDGNLKGLTYLGLANPGNDEGRNTLMESIARKAQLDIVSGRPTSTYSDAFTRHALNVAEVLKFLDQKRYVEASHGAVQIVYSGLAADLWKKRVYLYQYNRSNRRMQYWQRSAHGNVNKPLSSSDAVVPAQVRFFALGQGSPDDPRSLNALRESINATILGSMSLYSPLQRQLDYEFRTLTSKLHPQNIGGNILPPTVDTLMVHAPRDRIAEFRSRIILARADGLSCHVQRSQVTDEDDPTRFRSMIDLPMATVLDVLASTLVIPIGVARNLLGIRSVSEPEGSFRINLHLAADSIGRNAVSFSLDGASDRRYSFSELFGTNFGPRSTVDLWETQLRLSELRPEFGGRGDSHLIKALENQASDLKVGFETDRRKNRNDAYIRDSMITGLGLPVVFKIRSLLVRGSTDRYDSFSVVVLPSPEFGIAANANGIAKSLRSAGQPGDRLRAALATRLDEGGTWRDSLTSDVSKKKNASVHTRGFLRRHGPHDWRIECPSAGISSPASSVFVTEKTPSLVGEFFKATYRSVHRQVRRECGYETEVLSEDVDDDDFLTDVERKKKTESLKREEESKKVLERQRKKKPSIPNVSRSDDSDSEVEIVPRPKMKKSTSKKTSKENPSSKPKPSIEDTPTDDSDSEVEIVPRPKMKKSTSKKTSNENPSSKPKPSIKNTTTAFTPKPNNGPARKPAKSSFFDEPSE